MNLSKLWFFALLVPLAIEPACAPNEGDGNDDGDGESTGAAQSSLIAHSQFLWPMKDGAATVRVCWQPLDLGTEAFPAAAYAPDLPKVVAERQQWIQRIAVNGTPRRS